jgi:hypothetical protein
MEHSEIILTLEEVQIQLRHLHWQTKSHSQHEAYGKIYSDLDDLIDMFVEVCMGKHGRPDFTGGYQISGKDITEIEVNSFIDEVCEFFVSLSDVYDSKSDSDILNLRDEMLALFNKLKYLLTLE